MQGGRRDAPLVNEVDLKLEEYKNLPQWYEILNQREPL